MSKKGQMPKAVTAKKTTKRKRTFGAGASTERHLLRRHVQREIALHATKELLAILSFINSMPKRARRKGGTGK